VAPAAATSKPVEGMTYKWSMKTDRELIKLAKANLSAERIAVRMDRPYLSIERAAKRLGLHLSSSKRRPNGRFKAKM
jgi:hypothetical protein